VTPTEAAVQLHEAYAVEADRYAQAFELADRWLRRELVAASALEQIARLLGDVEHMEAKLAAAKAAWNGAGCRPAGELAALLTRVADLIARLQERLACAQRQTEEEKHALTPALDELIRSQHMRRAYGASRILSPTSGDPSDDR
jgi:hypothetical protein